MIMELSLDLTIGQAEKVRALLDAADRAPHDMGVIWFQMAKKLQLAYLLENLREDIADFN